MKKEHPILFSTEMVKAVLDDRKTQTRRIAKLPEEWHRGFRAFKNNPHGAEEFVIHGDCGTKTIYCPYGAVGDRLWVRESLLLQTEKGSPYFDVLYCADNTHLDGLHELDDWFMDYRNWYSLGKDKQIIPSIHMKKEAARIFLEITGLRVEILKEISDKDIICEGFETREDFFRTIIEINRPKNPEEFLNKWVWIRNFKKCQKKD